MGLLGRSRRHRLIFAHERVFNEFASRPLSSSIAHQSHGTIEHRIDTIVVQTPPSSNHTGPFHLVSFH